MPSIQEGTDGKLTVTIPKKLAVAKKWGKGDIVDFCIVDELNRAYPGDLIIKKVRAA